MVLRSLLLLLSMHLVSGLKMQGSADWKSDSSCTTELLEYKSDLTKNGWTTTGNNGCGISGYEKPSWVYNNFGGYVQAYCGGYGESGGYSTEAKTLTSLTGSGTGTLDYGNCWHQGEVNVYLQGNKISSASGATDHQVGIKKQVTFDFVDGDLLEVKDDVGNSVSCFKSLEICESAARAGGDPHVRNIKGEKFNINRMGYAPLVSVASDGVAHLEVMALIEGVQKCQKKMFITHVNSSGSWLQKNVAVAVGQTENQAFSVTVDGQEVWSPPSQGYEPPANYNTLFEHNEFSISEMSAKVTSAQQPGIKLKTTRDVEIKIVRPLHRAKAPPHLNFDIQGLQKLPRSLKLGGLLGGDDHSYWSARDEHCKNFARMQNENVQEVSSMAIAH